MFLILIGVFHILIGLFIFRNPERMGSRMRDDYEMDDNDLLKMQVLGVLVVSFVVIIINEITWSNSFNHRFNNYLVWCTAFFSLSSATRISVYLSTGCLL